MTAARASIVATLLALLLPGALAAAIEPRSSQVHPRTTSAHSPTASGKGTTTKSASARRQAPKQSAAKSAKSAPPEKSSKGAGIAAAPIDLALEVRRLIEATGLRKATIAVSVRDGSGRSIVDIRGDTPMLPASNMKLVTTGVALRTLGPDFSFRTRLLADGDRLTVVGDGDPAFGDPELLSTLASTSADGQSSQGFTIESLLARWSDAVVAAGITRVGELVIDDRIFEREFVHPMWPRDQLNERYCAEVCGLNFHLNRLHLYPRPIAGSKPDLSRIEPSVPFLEIRNRATSKSGRNDSNSLWISRSPERNDLTLNGNLKEPSQMPIPAVVHDMPALFGEILADRLRRKGVTVDRIRMAETSDAPARGNPVGPVFRTPIDTTIERANTDSDNLYAESLLKRSAAQATGRPGSWPLGAELTHRTLASAIGADAEPFTCSDGTGLSRGNRVTARGLTAWIDGLVRDPLLRDPFLDSLAVGGQTGTVRKRFRELDPGKVQVRCKTGYIAGVSTLSGVVESGGERWSFSVLGNDLTEATAVSKVRTLQEQIVRAVARRMPVSAAAPAMTGG